MIQKFSYYLLAQSLFETLNFSCTFNKSAQAIQHPVSQSGLTTAHASSVVGVLLVASLLILVRRAIPSGLTSALIVVVVITATMSFDC